MNVYLVIENYDGEFGEHVKGVYYTREDAIDAIVMNHDIDLEEAREMFEDTETKSDEEVTDMLEDSLRFDLDLYDRTDTVPEYIIKEVPMDTWGIYDEKGIIKVEEEEVAPEAPPAPSRDFNFDEYMSKEF